jgi:hypothetical protein
VAIEPARVEVIQRARNGERVTHAKKIVETVRYGI